MHVSHWHKDCDLKHCIPVSIHGDDADSHRRRNFMIVTFGSLLSVGCGGFFDTRLLCYCLDNSRAVPSTVATLDMWVVWSLLELQVGHYMDVDPWGQPYPPHASGRSGSICGPWRFIMVCHKGDEKYIQKVYKTSHSAVSKNVCILCDASCEPSSELMYTRHGVQAPHRRTLFSTQEFIQKIVGVHTWVRLPGFHISFIQHDWLHVCDLALVPESAASALVELVNEGYWGDAGTADERLRRGYVSFISACKRAKVRSRGVVFSMFLRFDGTIFCVVCVCVSFSQVDGIKTCTWPGLAVTSFTID